MPKHFPEHFKVRVETLNALAFRRVGGTVYAMFAAVMLLLVIGCGNDPSCCLRRALHGSMNWRCELRSAPLADVSCDNC